MQRTAHNPFSFEHLVDQIDSLYRLPAESRADGLEVTLLRITSAMSHYLSPHLRARPVEIDIPRLTIDGTGWMDLGLSEAQSAAVPIAAAKGRVMTGGLGLGYYTLAVAAKDDIDRVVVYEVEPRVIAWFTRTFGGRSEFKKLDIREGDVRRAKPDGPYDAVFMDPYLGMLRDDVLADIETFRPWVRSIDDYRFWGLEVVLLDAVQAGEDPRLLDPERDFFGAWERTLPEDETLRVPRTARTTKGSRRKVLEALSRV